MSEKGAGPEVEEVKAPAVEAAAPTKRLKAVVVAGGMNVPKADLTIVTEARSYKGGKDGEPLEVTVKKSHYPTGADVYLRYDPEVVFPADAMEILTVGDNVLQHNFGGFTNAAGYVNVGPAHPAYAAANLAHQRGATDIEIIGLTEDEKARLGPAFAELPNHPVEPAQVSVSFS